MAIDLPVEIKGKIVSLIKDIPQNRKQLRFIKPENAHITVKFLGDQEADNILSIIEFSKTVCAKQLLFDIKFNEVGIFSGLNGPRILWIGEKNVTFVNFANNFDELNFIKENHICHVTIARLKQMSKVQATALLKTTQTLLNKTDLTFSVKQITLFESLLYPDGPQYKPLAQFDLKQ